MKPITDMIRRLAGGNETQSRRVQAIWNGAVIAESDRTVKVEGNHYFPPEDVDHKYLQPSARHTVCPWKGTASYYDVVVGSQRNIAAAWYYPEPKPAAAGIRNHVAFWHGVKVSRAAAAGPDTDAA